MAKFHSPSIAGNWILQKMQIGWEIAAVPSHAPEERKSERESPINLGAMRRETQKTRVERRNRSTHSHNV
jgi:hypothetical protein